MWNWQTPKHIQHIFAIWPTYMPTLIPLQHCYLELFISIWSHKAKTMKPLIAHNSATEGHTGVIQITFLITRYLSYPKTRSKIAESDKKIEYYCQRSKMSNPGQGSKCLKNHQKIVPNSNWPFVLGLRRKMYFLTPRWPLITWPFCLKNFLLPIHILSQNMKCVRHIYW